MATKGIALLLLLSLLLFSGCVLPREEAPLVTTSRSFTITQGHEQRFRVTTNSSTPEYSIYADNVLNKTALFIIRPGDIPVALTEGGSQVVDLNGDGSTELVVTMGNTTGLDADITLYVAGASPVCTSGCGIGEAQRPYPDCSCYQAANHCIVPCPSGKMQRPYPDCTCYSENRTCSDGTVYGQCSQTKPQMCQSGSLVNNCTACNCPSGKSCNASSGACYTPAAATPTPSGSPSGSPTVTPTPAPTGTPAGAGNAAIAVANATTEGGVMARMDALYKKAQACAQSEFSSKFNAIKGRSPSPSELTAFSSTKSYLPTGVTVNATVNGSAYNVVYSTTGAHGGDALKIVVAAGAAVQRQWLDGTTTDQNIALANAAEGITGNCGLIMAVNNWT